MDLFKDADEGPSAHSGSLLHPIVSEFTSNMVLFVLEIGMLINVILLLLRSLSRHKNVMIVKIFDVNSVGLGIPTKTPKPSIPEVK